MIQFDFPTFRLEMHRQHGSTTLDGIVPHYLCPRCGAAAKRNKSITVGADYVDLDGMLHASRMTPGAVPPSVACDRCGTAAPLAGADYHSYHSSARKDLVVRYAPGLSAPVLLWFAENGYEAVGPIDDVARARFGRDARLRRAMAVLETQGAERARDAIREAFTFAPSERDLLRFVMPMVQIGETALAGAMAEARIAAARTDPDGYVALGEVLLAGAQHGAASRADRERGVSVFWTAIQLDPTFRRAYERLALFYRVLGDDAQAVRIYREIMRRWPELPEPMWTLAVTLLPTAPAESLELFTRAEPLAPHDADYPIGCARALIALGRRSEARTALDRARALAPNHARIRELDAILARH